MAVYYKAPCSVCGGVSSTYNGKSATWRCEKHKVGRTSFFGLDVEQLKKEHNFCDKCKQVKHTRTIKIMSKDKKMPRLIDMDVCYTCKRK